MFGFGITELIVVGLVILMLFSPRELPGMMKTLARVYGSIRRTAEEFRAQVMEAEELREPIEEIRAAYHGTKQELLTAQELARRELGRARAEAMKAQQKLSELHREETRRETAALQGRVSASEALDDEPARPASASASSAHTPASTSAPASASTSAPAPAASSAPVLEASKPAASPPVPEASKPIAAASTTPGASGGLVVPPAPRYPRPVSDRSDAA